MARIKKTANRRDVDGQIRPYLGTIFRNMVSTNYPVGLKTSSSPQLTIAATRRIEKRRLQDDDDDHNQGPYSSHARNKRQRNDEEEEEEGDDDGVDQSSPRKLKPGTKGTKTNPIGIGHDGDGRNNDNPPFVPPNPPRAARVAAPEGFNFNATVGGVVFASRFIPSLQANPVPRPVESAIRSTIPIRPSANPGWSSRLGNVLATTGNLRGYGLTPQNQDAWAASTLISMSAGRTNYPPRVAYPARNVDDDETEADIAGEGEDVQVSQYQAAQAAALEPALYWPFVGRAPVQAPAPSSAPAPATTPSPTIAPVPTPVPVASPVLAPIPGSAVAPAPGPAPAAAPSSPADIVEGFARRLQGLNQPLSQQPRQPRATRQIQLGAGTTGRLPKAQSQGKAVVRGTSFGNVTLNVPAAAPLPSPQEEGGGNATVRVSASPEVPSEAESDISEYKEEHKPREKEPLVTTRITRSASRRGDTSTSGTTNPTASPAATAPIAAPRRATRGGRRGGRGRGAANAPGNAAMAAPPVPAGGTRRGRRGAAAPVAQITAPAAQVGGPTLASRCMAALGVTSIAKPNLNSFQRQRRIPTASLPLPLNVPRTTMGDYKIDGIAARNDPQGMAILRAAWARNPSHDPARNNKPQNWSFGCPDCGDTFQKRDKAQTHYETAHLFIHWLCGGCNTIVKRYYELKKHYGKIHPQLKAIHCEGAKDRWERMMRLAAQGAENANLTLSTYQSNQAIRDENGPLAQAAQGDDDEDEEEEEQEEEEEEEL